MGDQCGCRRITATTVTNIKEAFNVDKSTDKLQAWLDRIAQPPKPEVANLDYWDFLVETRIVEEVPNP